MRWRRLGVVVVVAGLAVALHGADPLDPVGAQWLVTVVGGVALAAAALLGVTVPVLDGEHWRPDDVESGLPGRTPGDTIEGLSGRAFRRRLRAHVADALVANGHDRADAERMLDEGTWTDDRFAAACLGDRSVRSGLAVRIATVGSSTLTASLVRERVTSALLALRDEAGMDR